MALQEDNASSKSNSIASHHSVDSTAAVSVSSSVSLPVATNHDDQVPTFSRHRKVCVSLVPGHWSLGNVRVPTRTGKPGKMERHFPVREKSGNFEQTGKVRENHTKYWKTQGISEKFYLLFLVIFK